MRELALALLNDDYGISASACSILYRLLEESGNSDINTATVMRNNRYYLKEDFAGSIPEDCPF